jgi:hypothetical protein
MSLNGSVMRTIWRADVPAMLLASVMMIACASEEHKVVYHDGAPPKDTKNTSPPTNDTAEPPDVGDPGVNSCKGICGVPMKQTDPCGCDLECLKWGDCCDDFEGYCDDLIKDPPTEDTSGGDAKVDPNYEFPDPYVPAELSYNDCKGIAKSDGNWCDTYDCRGIAKRNYSYCTTADCKGIASGNKSWCSSKNCKAMADSYKCEMDHKSDKENLEACKLEAMNWCDNYDCRGIATGNFSYCKSYQCKAIVKKDYSYCTYAD